MGIERTMRDEVVRNLELAVEWLRADKPLPGSLAEDLRVVAEEVENLIDLEEE